MRIIEGREGWRFNKERGTNFFFLSFLKVGGLGFYEQSPPYSISIGPYKLIRHPFKFLDLK